MQTCFYPSSATTVLGSHSTPSTVCYRVLHLPCPALEIFNPFVWIFKWEYIKIHCSTETILLLSLIYYFIFLLWFLIPFHPSFSPPRLRNKRTKDAFDFNSLEATECCLYIVKRVSTLQNTNDYIKDCKTVSSKRASMYFVLY